MRSKEIEQIAAKAAEHFGPVGFPNAGKLNVYVCQGKRGVGGAGFKLVQTQAPCGRRMVTVDREPGVTPFITACPDCNGETQSSMYRVPASLQPTHEWYRPDSLAGLKGHEREHVEKGGLLLREIVKAEADEPKHRDPEWRRFVGDISSVAMVDGNTPTVGIGSDICDECETRRVLIACISEAGHECNIGIAPETALEVADAIRAAALKVIEAKGQS